MNGLLHRLAARAAGSGLTVRADVGVAYPGSGAGEFDVVEEHADVPAPVAARASTPAAAAPQPTAARDSGTAFDAPAANPHTPHAHPGPGFSTTIIQTIDAGERAMPPQARPFQPAPVATPPAAMLPERAAPSAPPRPPGAAPHAQIPARPALSAALPEPFTHSTATAPAPLLPRSAQAPALAPIAPPVQRRAGIASAGQTAVAAQAASDDATEVHIHIGRIDVTAVQEAPAGKRRPAPAPAPMSLDGYLAKRSRT